MFIELDVRKCYNYHYMKKKENILNEKIFDHSVPDTAYCVVRDS